MANKKISNTWAGIFSLKEDGKWSMNMDQYNNTVIAQAKQKSRIANHSDIHGPQTQFSTHSASKDIRTTNNKPISADGIEMGYQIEKGIIPVVYGHVGMTGTQFGKGQTVSNIDADKVRQTIRIPLSEGPIVGLSYQPAGTVITDSNIHITPGLNNPEHAKATIINRIQVVSPVDDKAKFQDIDLVVTKGDGTTAPQQSFSITNIEPILTNPDTGASDVPVEEEADPLKLNDLADVSATVKGPDSVIHWNTDSGAWESKSLSDMLRGLDITTTGGTGGTGGSGGTAGDGGVGGSGGVGSFSESIYYTQWNPPPSAVRVVYSGTGQIVDESNIITTTTQTDPPILPATVTSDGAPLRNIDQTTPEFSCNMSFANVDEKVEEISIVMNFPDGLYKEITSEVETKTAQTANPHADVHHEIILCDSVREPLLNQGSSLVDARGDVDSTGGGDLECLNAHRSIEIATVAATASESYQKATTITRTTGYLWVNYVLTTELCGREFVLDEGTYQISDTKLSAWEHTETLALSSMNAGSGARLTGDLRGSHKIGPFSDTINADCESATVENFNWSSYVLADYLAMYPGQIISSVTGESKIKIYTWIENRHFSYDTGLTDTTVKTDDYTLSTNCYLKELKIEKPMNVFGDYYSLRGTTVKPFQLQGPNHNWRWGRRLGNASDANNFKAELTAKPYDLGDNRIQAGLVGSAYGAFSYPVPLAIMANINPGSSGGTGTAGTTGDAGITGTPGTTGTVTVPVVDPIPTIACSKGNYDSTLVTTQVLTFLTINPSHTSASEILTLTIDVPAGSGTLDVVTVPASGVTVTGTGTATLVLVGNITKLQTCLNSGIQYSILATTSGTQELNLHIIGTENPLGSREVCKILDIPTRDLNLSRLHHSATQYDDTFSNTLVDANISWAELIYQPLQDKDELKLEEVAFIIGGRDSMEAPSENNISLSSWINSDYVSATKTWTNNTAWIFWDYLTNVTYGLGEDILLTAEQKENLYSDIYTAAVWCSHQPTGSTLPVSTFNGVLFGAESKIDALQKIATSMHSNFVFVNGNPRLISDASAFSWTDGSYVNYPVAKKVVNQTNAANMTYVGGSMENIFNVIKVKWNNPDNYHKLETKTYENAASIALYNRREITIELLGCANEQQALWHGAWFFETNKSNTDMVSYIAGWDHYDLSPGDLISLSDEYRPGSTLKGGRVISDNGGTVTLDREAPVGLIAIMDTFGVVQHGTVSGGAPNFTNSTATIAGTFDAGAVWNSYTGTDEPLAANYRIISIEESSDGIYAVTAGIFDFDKYNRVWANTI